ncbi:hypothetical protein FIBSPDRAFT_954325 [Athelia psychrophila]|uniref:Uncharacterized protein n=1 Tax=Athelia psychrophila TaxID=1759441 RepID=A0A166J925_9AGAM|nr:hypothetical protein FIBSPDRAFT_954325 [Fibularhizoctonia sp. CBS 109695]
MLNAKIAICDNENSNGAEIEVKRRRRKVSRATIKGPIKPDLEKGPHYRLGATRCRVAVGPRASRVNQSVSAAVKIIMMRTNTDGSTLTPPSAQCEPGTSSSPNRPPPHIHPPHPHNSPTQTAHSRASSFLPPLGATTPIPSSSGLHGSTMRNTRHASAEERPT